MIKQKVDIGAFRHTDSQSSLNFSRFLSKLLFCKTPKFRVKGGSKNFKMAYNSTCLFDRWTMESCALNDPWSHDGKSYIIRELNELEQMTCAWYKPDRNKDALFLSASCIRVKKQKSWIAIIQKNIYDFIFTLNYCCESFPTFHWIRYSLTMLLVYQN